MTLLLTQMAIILLITVLRLAGAQSRPGARDR